MKINIKIFLVIVSLLWLMPAVSLAAEIFFNSDKSIFPERESFLVEVFMDTEGAQINVVEGTIIFPEELLELKELREGNSTLNFWLDKPESTEAGHISFSGMTPGGFSGTDRFLLGIVFETKGSGAGSLGFSGTQALRNDGLGTKTDINEISFDFTVSPSAESAADLALLDTNSPESFTPFVASDPSLFEGRYFVVFSTVDKGVGMDHYEVREGLFGGYVVAESPYLLKDQSLGKSIYIKALDKSGNERIVKIEAQNGGFRLDRWGIIVILLVVFGFFLQKKWPKFIQK
ncbi:MAG: hypothetical protein Q8P52_01175 [bacterium]|nr:hypothetical protein [bacterium]